MEIPQTYRSTLDIPQKYHGNPIDFFRHPKEISKKIHRNPLEILQNPRSCIEIPQKTYSSPTEIAKKYHRNHTGIHGIPLDISYKKPWASLRYTTNISQKSHRNSTDTPLKYERNPKKNSVDIMQKYSNQHLESKQKSYRNCIEIPSIEVPQKMGKDYHRNHTGIPWKSLRHIIKIQWTSLWASL